MFYALIVAGCFDKSISFPSVLLLAAAGSVLGQFGDLMFSYIKREYNIKDYGKYSLAMAGGSTGLTALRFTTPLVYIMIRLFP